MALFDGVVRKDVLWEKVERKHSNGGLVCGGLTWLIQLSLDYSTDGWTIPKNATSADFMLDFLQICL